MFLFPTGIFLIKDNQHLMQVKAHRFTKDRNTLIFTDVWGGGGEG